MWGVWGSQGVMTGQEYAVMWGVCGSLGGQVRSRQCCGECVDHREDRSGVGSDVGSVWITGSGGQVRSRQ